MRVVVDIHLRIVPSRSSGRIAQCDPLLFERQWLHVEKRSQTVKLIISDQDVNPLRPRIDDSHGSVAGLLDHVLELEGESGHGWVQYSSGQDTLPRPFPSQWHR